VTDEVEFRRDLFRGVAADYDTFRLGYPDELIQDLLRRSNVRGHGAVLDLACGTGQIAFALAPAFSEVWAVDQEPDMIARVSDKASDAGLVHMHSVASDAESFAAPPQSFELVTVGNAFHRFRRDAVAGRMFGWLRSGGHAALVWSQSPWVGAAEWQTVLSDVLERWKAISPGRIPEGWEEPRRERPDRLVMAEKGFEFLGAFDFWVERRWAVTDLIGFVYATSFLPRSVLGARVAEFESDMHGSLDRFGDGVGLPQRVGFGYELYRRPRISALRG
jgi:SAM-dependent methyltransferase